MKTGDLREDRHSFMASEFKLRFLTKTPTDYKVGRPTPRQLHMIHNCKRAIKSPSLSAVIQVKDRFLLLR